MKPFCLLLNFHESHHPSGIHEVEVLLFFFHSYFHFRFLVSNFLQQISKWICQFFSLLLLIRLCFIDTSQWVWWQTGQDFFSINWNNPALLEPIMFLEASGSVLFIKVFYRNGNWITDTVDSCFPGPVSQVVRICCKFTLRGWKKASLSGWITCVEFWGKKCK